MIPVRNIAIYISNRYMREYGVRIDEMKLHKLLYFSQREALIQIGEPIFEEQFTAWKYGPVLLEIHELYKHGELFNYNDAKLDAIYIPILDSVFEQYAPKDSWSLSRISHGEYSWENARKGVPQTQNCNNRISIEDIKIDADRIKVRRFLLKKLANAV